MTLDKIIATGLGIGWIRKGGGTLAAAVCGLVWYLLFSGGYDPVITLLITVVVTDLELWSAQRAEKYWGVDSNHVVIDEIAGMCLSLLFVPVTMATVLTAFVLFRVFDIWETPVYPENGSIAGRRGVMADDLLAGLYTNMILQVPAMDICFLDMYTFLKSQTASLLATAADFSITFICVELIGVWYGTASVLGTVFGALVHFSISRKWVFLAGRKPIGRQAVRYGIVWAGYLALSFLLLVSLPVIPASATV